MNLTSVLLLLSWVKAASTRKVVDFCFHCDCNVSGPNADRLLQVKKNIIPHDRCSLRDIPGFRNYDHICIGSEPTSDQGSCSVCIFTYAVCSSIILNKLTFLKSIVYTPKAITSPAGWRQTKQFTDPIMIYRSLLTVVKCQFCILAWPPPPTPLTMTYSAFYPLWDGKMSTSYGSSPSAWSKGRQLSGAVLH